MPHHRKPLRLQALHLNVILYTDCLTTHAKGWDDVHFLLYFGRTLTVLPHSRNVNVGRNERENGVLVYRLNIYVRHMVNKFFANEGDISLLQECSSSIPEWSGPSMGFNTRYSESCATARQSPRRPRTVSRRPTDRNRSTHCLWARPPHTLLP